MVLRLRKIFGDPKPILELQHQKSTFPGSLLKLIFGDRQSSPGYEIDFEEFASACKSPWHERNGIDELSWTILHDLENVELQKRCFKYIFPIQLIRWWENILKHDTEGWGLDLYIPIRDKELFERFLTVEEQKAVCDWITDAYIEAVDKQLEFTGQAAFYSLNDLKIFIELGQTVPVFSSILAQVGEKPNRARAYWWLTLATGVLLLEPQDAVADSPIVKDHLFPQSFASEEDSRFRTKRHVLPENMRILRAVLTRENILEKLRQAIEFIPEFPDGKWAYSAWEEWFAHPGDVDLRLESLFRSL